MKYYLKIAVFILTLALLIYGCSSSNGSSSNNIKSYSSDITQRGLKDYYSEYFPIGASIAPRSLSGPESQLIKKEFSSVTIEYLLQLKHIYKEPGYYDFTAADKMIDFVKKNNLKLRGHSLCWHDQIPDWYLKKDGKNLTKNELLAKLQQHIETMVTRYKDLIYAWDVVNEAVSNEDNQYIETSPYQKIIGDEYIAKAFEFAHRADPKAKLFYNDNYFLNPIKRKKVMKLVEDLKKSKVPIHGIGIQGHWSIYSPNEEELRTMLDEVISLGLEIQITELDLSIHPKNNNERMKMTLMKLYQDEDVYELQAQKYEMLFRVFREYKSHITGVTFWNVSDYYSWMDKKDKKHFPLLFNENFGRKDAYYRIIPK